ncbi:peptidoglycan-binding protein [Serinicoccus sediminis]|uniref:peptidoglycan-binding protein n=1 Tax=Serinicoccus sediminis TaxID=2306021 RepID=UPI00101F7A5F|nr:peptidoglycan-binding protein [Serinicoccus sediminis]
MTQHPGEITPRSVRGASWRPTMFDRLPAVYRDPVRFRPTHLVDPGPGEQLRAVREEDMLDLGSEGDVTRVLQQALAVARHDPGPADGAYGPRTQDAVRAFQRQRGLTVDGIVGPETVGELTAPFLQRFLDGLQDVFDPVLSTLDNLAAYLTVDTAPGPFLRWLAWVVGAQSSVADDAAQDRLLVARALELYRQGATRQGIAEIVGTHLGLAPERVGVTDGGDTAWDPDPHAVVTGEGSSHVTVEVPRDAVPDPGRCMGPLREVVARTLPVGLTVEVVLTG